MPAAQRELVDEDWHALLLPAHQLSTYLDDYHVRLDAQLGAKDRATEMITEIYVPRQALPSFMAETTQVFRTNGVPIVYGTVGLIEQDAESFLDVSPARAPRPGRGVLPAAAGVPAAQAEIRSR